MISTLGNNECSHVNTFYTDSLIKREKKIECKNIPKTQKSIHNNKMFEDIYKKKIALKVNTDFIFI